MRKRDKTEKTTGVAAVSILCMDLLLTACVGENPEPGQGGQEVLTDQAGQEEDWLAQRVKCDRRTENDLRTEPEDGKTAERVDLNACETGQVVLDGGDIWLSGSMEGQIVIDAEEDETVHLYLAGAEITSPNGPALWVKEASKTVVTLVSDTENTLADSPNYIGYEEMQGCLYSVCDLTVNGGGALQVFGYHEDGIRSKDRIKILDGALTVQAKGDGIRGNDGIYIQDASVVVESEKNGLRTVNQGADDKGVIEINGGALSVIAGKSGICAAADVYMYHGRYSVNAVEEKVRTEGTAYIAEGKEGSGDIGRRELWQSTGMSINTG